MNFSSVSRSLGSDHNACTGRPRLGPPVATGRGLTLRNRSPLIGHGSREAVGLPIVRRVRAGDADGFQAFIMALSPASRRMRFHGAIAGCSPALLQYLTQTGDPHHQAWLASDCAAAGQPVIGEARFVVGADGPDAEFAIVVADDQRGRGVADRLLQTMVAAAHAAGVRRLFGDVLEDNFRMFAFLRRHGFQIDAAADVDGGVVRWQRMPGAAAASPAGAPSRPADGARQRCDATMTCAAC